MSPSARMPSAARLVAALCLAALGWYASDMVRALMPRGTDFGWFNHVNAGLGLACGWIIVGGRAGYGFGEGVAAGLTAVAALVFWALALQSLNEMLRHALQRRYDGPVEGLLALFGIGADYGARLLDVELIAVLVAGGVLTGIVADRIARHWS